MATTEEIERRVEDADAARSARRSAAAQRVGELAARRAEIAQQLSDVERELGDVIAEASDVIQIGELATFTDVPAADLTRWLQSRKNQRAKGKKPTGRSPGPQRTTHQKPAAPRTPTIEKTPTPQDVSRAPNGATAMPAGVT